MTSHAAINELFILSLRKVTYFPQSIVISLPRPMRHIWSSLPSLFHVLLSSSFITCSSNNCLLAVPEIHQHALVYSLNSKLFPLIDGSFLQVCEDSLTSFLLVLVKMSLSLNRWQKTELKLIKNIDNIVISHMIKGPINCFHKPPKLFSCCW